MSMKIYHDIFRWASFLPIVMGSWWALHLGNWDCRIFTLIFLLWFTIFCSFQFSSVTQSYPTVCDPLACSTPAYPVHHQLPELTQTQIYWVSDATQPSLPLCPLLLLPSIFPSIRVFSNDSVLCIRWPKNWSFSFSISPSNEYSELISFRMNWLDLLAVQRTLKSLPQHHSSKASILRRSAFFTVQLSHPYVTTRKTTALIDGPLLAK